MNNRRRVFRKRQPAARRADLYAASTSAGAESRHHPDTQDPTRPAGPAPLQLLTEETGRFYFSFFFVLFFSKNTAPV